MKKLKREEMVVMATCQKTKKPFGITVQKKGNEYEFTWAFKINPSSVKKEGYDKNKANGNIFMNENFPGCPHCNATSWFQCGKCKSFVCMDEGTEMVKCPLCGNEGKVVTSDNFDLSGDEL